MSKTKVTVRQSDKPEEEIPVEVLATHIAKLADVGKQLSESRLSRRAILLLLSDATGIGKKEIGQVIDAIPDLKKRYLK